MSYLRGGVEYVTWDEFTVLNAVKALNDQHRTTNSSQIANTAGLSRTRVSDLVMGLQRRGYLKDVSKGAAYHWRPTGKEARLEGTTPESRDAAVAKAAGELSASAPGLDKVLTEAEAEDDTIMGHEAAAAAAYAEYVRHTNRVVELMAQQAEGRRS